MGKRTRITKKDLKHDALLEGASKTTRFIEDHLNKVLIAAVVVIVVIVAWNFVGRSRRATELQANAALTNASQTLSAGLYAQAAEQLQMVITDYPGTRSAGAAVCYLGTIHFQEGRYEDALARFDEYLHRYGPEDIMGTTALEGRAAVLEQQREFAQAADAYQRLAQSAQDNPAAYAGYMLDAIRAHRSEANWEGVRDTATALIDKYPDAYMVDQARMALAEAQARLRA